MGFTKGNVRKFGKLRSRPRGRRSQAKVSLREFAGMVVMDPRVHERILKQARAGTLSPRLVIELFHYHGGKPPDRVEITKPRRDDAERAARLGRLSEEEREKYADLLIKMRGQPA